MEFNEITSYFYRSHSAKDALAALKYFLGTDSVGDTLELGCWGPVPYFFYRVAQVYPQLWGKYEELFEKSSHEKRLFLLLVFSHEEDNQINRYLLSWQKNKKFSKEYSEIDAALSEEGKGKNIPEIKRVISASALDLLWVEFIVTGRQAAIERIISVLAWDDLIRNKLEEALGEIHANHQVALPAENSLYTNLLNQGILIDSHHHLICSAQDLDCFCARVGCDRIPDRLELMQSIFPFELSDDEVIHVLIKSAAKWSLCSNAMQHDLVLNTCIAESKKRTGRCRLSSLEIVSRTYLALNDMEQGLKYFIESLTFDPIERQKQTQNAELAFKELHGLVIKPEELVPDTALNSESFMNKCIESCESLHTYRSKMIWEEDSKSDTSSNVFWELEFQKPDKYRVSQTAGDDFDERITIGDIHYRGPMYGKSQFEKSTAFESDKYFNQGLLLDSYLNVMKDKQPSSVDRSHSDIGDFIILTFSDLEATALSLFNNRETNFRISSLRLWIKQKTNILVKAELFIHATEDSGLTENLRIYHLFTEFDSSIIVNPPPFEIINWSNYDQAYSEKPDNINVLKRQRLIIRLSGFMIGMLVGIGIAYSLSLSETEGFFEIFISFIYITWILARRSWKLLGRFSSRNNT